VIAMNSIANAAPVIAFSIVRPPIEIASNEQT